MDNEEKINEILKTFAKAIVPDYFINKESEYFVTANTEISQLIEQAEEETIRKVLEVIGKKKREASDLIRIKSDNFFSMGALFVLDDLLASLQEEQEPNTQ